MLSRHRVFSRMALTHFQLSQVMGNDTASQISNYDNFIQASRYQKFYDGGNIVQLKEKNFKYLIPFVSSDDDEKKTIHCAICDTDEDNAEHHPQACPNCKNYICEKCCLDWEKMKRKLEQILTCPYCRFIWKDDDDDDSLNDWILRDVIERT